MANMSLVSAHSWQAVECHTSLLPLCSNQTPLPQRQSVHSCYDLNSFTSSHASSPWNHTVGNLLGLASFFKSLYAKYILGFLQILHAYTISSV